ncbi:hypothetical protein [Streptomyces sp. NPDC007088]|uniref:hypothetical protein n=1 Tax=Streptomyces sp. NPDC007088 TaxID=3364773 RepID=UPI003690E977
MRHEVQPGRLFLGLTFVAVALVYAGDAGGVWESPWWLGAPVLAVGVLLAVGAVSVTYAVRGRTPRRTRGRGRFPREGEGTGPGADGAREPADEG